MGKIKLLSPLITIDRSQPLVYPDWGDKPLYPKLEAKGPQKIEVAKLEQWLLPGQKNNWIEGTVIHDHLKNHNLLPTCLGLHELLAIQAEGLGFFRQYFQNKAVFGWKGVVRDRDSDLKVPYLVESVESDGEVVLIWRYLVDYWNASNPALRFAN